MLGTSCRWTERAVCIWMGEMAILKCCIDCWMTDRRGSAVYVYCKVLFVHNHTIVL